MTKPEIMSIENKEIVSLKDVKVFLSINNNDYDDALKMITATASTFLQCYLRKIFLPRKIIFKLSQSTKINEIEFPFGPINKFISQEEKQDDDQKILLVTYEIGYDHVPMNIKYSLLVIISEMFHKQSITKNYIDEILQFNRYGIFDV